MSTHIRPWLVPIIGLALGATVTVASVDEPSTAGALTARDDNRGLVELPLRHTDVNVEISAFVARTTIEQVFDNPFQHPIEVTYTFPLGDEAAVDDFEMRCGGRIVRGEIHRRDEARRLYEEARDEGYQAALLEQRRPNVFLQTISNLMPGDEVRIRIRTIELLEYTDGIYEYVFPLVVAPRYDPGREPAADATHNMEEPPLLAAGQRSGHDVAIHVEIDAGVPLDDPVSPNQTIYVRRVGPSSSVVDLAEASSIPNKDFVLRWRVDGRFPTLGLLTHRSEEAGFFTILVQPKGRIDALEAAPRDVIMVLDTSGSMSGIPIEMSTRFVKDALRSLGSRDRFNLVCFDSGARSFSEKMLTNDPREIRRALNWIGSLKGHGGTEMLRGVRKALEIEGAPGRFRQIIFLTDGHIGNEAQIIEAVSRFPESYRVFTIGIGSAVNHFLLDRMAEAGGGAYTFIPDDHDRARALEQFEQWITRPYLTDLEFDWGGLPIRDLVPERPMDLFSGQNLYLIGRYDQAAEGTITAHGYLGGEYWEQELSVTLPERDASHAALASVWARNRIKALLAPDPGLSEEEVRERVTDLALQYRLMSPFTSFIAVDYSSRANPSGRWDRVVQAVPLPAGVAEAMADRAEAIPAMLTALAVDDELTERVLVTAASGVVDLGSTAQTTRFSDEFVADLPVPGRFYQNVLTLAPGVQEAVPVENAGAHGSRSRGFQAEVSGVSNVDPLTGRLLSSIATNSISEIEVIGAGAGVEFSRAQGGFARIVQKQGSNVLEGALDLRYGSHALDGGARDADLAFDGYQAGLMLSGPFIRDRLWFRLSHDWTRRDDPVDTNTSLLPVPTEAEAHSDRLTWQVSPRNKLAFEVAREDLSMSGVGVSSWTGPGSASSIASGGPRYSLTWIAPLSPKTLFETVVAYRRRSFETRPTQPAAENTCNAVPGDGSSTLHCLNLPAHNVSGPAAEDRSQDDRRFSVQVDATFYGGRLFGATHRLKAGGLIEDEAFAREVVREPTLIRFASDNGEGSLLAARFAVDDRDDAHAEAAYWAIYAQDEMKPASNVAITLGLRLERTELNGTGWTSPEPGNPFSSPATRRPESLAVTDMSLAPSVSVSWDPWSWGRSKFWLSARRYQGRLHPGLVTIESEPVTFDTVVAEDTGLMPDPESLDLAPNVQIVDRDLGAPHHDEWTAGFEHQVWAESKIVFRLVDRRYEDQIGHVDLNVGAEHGDLVVSDPTARRDPSWGEVLLVGNLESMRYRAVVVEWIRRQYRDWEMQASYIYSLFEGTAAPFDPLAGDERNRVEVKPGYQSDDQRHLFTITATTVTPWSFRIGGVLRWESGVPFSLLDSHRVYRGRPGESVPVPRLFYTTARRNDQRNDSMWTLDAKITRELSLGRDLELQVSLEVLNLFDDDTYLVYNDAQGNGVRIDGVDEALRRTGRRIQLGMRLSF